MKSPINFPINNLKDLNQFYIQDYTEAVGEAPTPDLLGMLNGDVDEMYEVEYAQAIVELMKKRKLIDEETASKLIGEIAEEFWS